MKNQWLLLNLHQSVCDCERKDPNVAWDGRLNGRDFNAAVFAYKLIAKFKDGSQFIKTGDVTLLR
ncbi:MAG: hypothetical protein ABJB16_05120 [Saprospiraceae bacterium]